MSRRFSDADLVRLQAHIDATGSTEGFVPTPRRRQRNDESRMQQALIQWWVLAHRQFKVPEHSLFAVPNGGLRDVRIGRLLKKEGARAGVPDLFLATPNGRGKHGLFIEMKTEVGRVSPEQTVMLNNLRNFGYEVHVCRSTDIAINIITAYLT